MSGERDLGRHIDLGDGHALRIIVDGQGRRIGAIHEHPDPNSPDGTCSGAIWFDVPAMHEMERQSGVIRPKWTIEQEDPLTLSPSILCRGGCNAHGWVREGKWIDA